MMRNGSKTLLSLVGQFKLCARKCGVFRKSATATVVKRAVNDVRYVEPVTPGYLFKTLGSSYIKWQRIMDKHPELKALKSKDIINSVNFLTSCNYDLEDIIAKPMILYQNVTTLENRRNVLLECGVQNISVGLLFRFVTMMNKEVVMLKSHAFIPFDLNLAEQLRNCFKDIHLEIPAECNDENLTLKIIRQHFLNSYVRQRLGMTDSDIQKMWKVYPRVRHKSFDSIQKMMRLLEELNFPKERIIKNAYLLYADEQNVRRIIAEVPTLNGQDIRGIIYRRPKLVMSSFDALKKILGHIKQFGIREDAITRCLEVLTLSPDTVLERLQDLQHIEEFQVLISNPRVLRLVHYRNKAVTRLEYLNQLKVRCASLHILSCGSTAFARFAKDGSDRTKGCDSIVYLVNLFGKDSKLLRNLLSRHPYWCHVPLVHVKQCYDFLNHKGFSKDDIFNNIQLLLYPTNHIEEKLSLLKTNKYLKDLELNITPQDLTKHNILALTLYSIESEYHFSGDGIWPDHASQHMENFHNLLPDFPESMNKEHRYGIRVPPNKHTEEVVIQGL